MHVGETTPLMSIVSPRTTHDDSHASLVTIENGESSDKDNWDYVIVYSAALTDGSPEAQSRADKRVTMFAELQRAGLIVEKKESLDNSSYFVLIKATEERLEEQAELLGMFLSLKAEYHGGSCPFTIAKRDLFEPADGASLFTKTNKQYLIYSIMTGDDEDGGADIDLSKFQYDGVIDKAYPMHEERVKERLVSDWVFKPPMSLNEVLTIPIDTLRAYFGEEIGFYYGWLTFYTKWLWVASAVGLVTFIIGYANITAENKWSNTIYSVFMAIWVTLFLEFWKRERNVLAWKWNMLNYEEVEGVRPGFIGIEKLGVYSKGEFVELKKGEIYGLSEPKPTKYFPKRKVQIKMLAGLGILVTLCCVVVMASIAVLTFRLFVQKSEKYANFSGAVGGIVNAVVILILNKVYRNIAQRMNEWENHRTVTDFHDNLLFKIFLFQFVNSYTSLYYIAFFKGHTFLWGSNKLHDQCGEGDQSSEIDNEWGWGCPNELQTQLITLLLTNIVVGQAQEVLIPWLLSKGKMWYYRHITHSEDVDLPKYERENQLNQHEGTFDEYSEMVIQYGYITLFAAAFPLAPLLAAANNLVELRSDTWKWLNAYNKPIYRGADDIGGWYTILETIGIVAVLTNSLLITFSFPTIFKILHSNPYLTLLVVVILEHVIFVAKYVLALAVPDVPANIRTILAKQYYVQQQIVKKYERGFHKRSRQATQSTPKPGRESPPGSPNVRLFSPETSPPDSPFAEL